jgi:competence CoiA-like predicted nuclease/uncharacterized protein YkuJ
MSQLSLGAINKLTGDYVYPKIANKKDEYICPECNKDLIVCKGEIRVHYFRHKVDSVNPCHHYCNPTESQIHKDAKLLLKTLLERKIQISFIRNCGLCKKDEEYEITKMTETSRIELEYRFEYNGLKIADVGYIDDDELLCVFEICNTHKTCSDDRPEPWFEINAETLISIANDNSLTSLQIPCIRCKKCDDCIEIYNANLKDCDIEKYVRVKLGQKIFPTPDFQPGCYENREDATNCKCVKCEYNKRYWYWRHSHLRFDFDARHDITNNKNIIELFSEDFINKKIVIHSWKGGLFAYVISKISYNKYDYWKSDVNYACGIMGFPCEKIIDYSRYSTTEIIIELIKLCQNVSFIKQERINTIKHNIIEVDNRKQQWQNEMNARDNDADAFRSDDKYTNHKIALTNELTFVENDITYTLGNHVIIIEHPLTHTKIKRSIVNNKTFYQGKWRTNISIKLIISWYNSNYDLFDELY